MAEGTLETKVEQVDPQREALIAEMLRDAKTIELTGELTKNPVIHKGDSILDAPMVVKNISSAGYVFIWDTRSFEKIPILYYMLGQKLRQRRQDGSYQFTTFDPRQLPKRGTIKCMLHKDGEKRAHFDELGFRGCPKENITNTYQLRRHMMLKHPQEWKAIEEERIDKEKAEDRALQRLLLAGQLTRTEPPIVETKPIEETKPVDVTAEEPKLVPTIDNAEFACPTCNKTFKYEKVFKKHKKTCK